MTRRLILMRHAKSDWTEGSSDHDRPLNARGRKACKTLGSWLQSEGFLPDQALVSTALRARETFEGLGLDFEADLVGALYHASSDLMLKTLKGAAGHCVLMVGHNPGIADLASRLVIEPPDHNRFSDFPTGATLVVDFGIDTWGAIIPGQGQAAAFIVPRELD